MKGKRCTSMLDHIRVCEVLSPQESGVFTDHGVVSFEFCISSKALHKVNRTVYENRRGDFDVLRRVLESLDLCNLVQDSEDINLDWIQWKDTFMSPVSHFIPTKTVKGKNSPPWIMGEIIPILWKNLQQVNNSTRNTESYVRERRI